MRKKNKDTIKRYAIDIIIGIVTSAICFLLQGIIKNAPTASKNVFVTLQNLVYTSASEISSNSLLIILIIMGVSVLVAFNLMPLFLSILGKKNEIEDADFEKECEEYRKKYFELHTKLEEYKSETPLNAAKIENCLKEIKKCDNDFLSGDSSAKKKRKTGIFPIIILIIYLIVFVIIEIIPTFILNDFNRDIVMIKPYTDNKTIITLESDWTRMKSKDDFDKIYDTINQIKKENGLTKK